MRKKRPCGCLAAMLAAVLAVSPAYAASGERTGGDIPVKLEKNIRSAIGEAGGAEIARAEKKKLQTGVVVKVTDERGKEFYVLVKDSGDVRMIIDEEGDVLLDRPDEEAWDDMSFVSSGNSMNMKTSGVALEEEAFAAESIPYGEPRAFNTERYATVEETGFVSAKDDPLSTFGMDVDTASYTLLRKKVACENLGSMPEDAVRIEEMINYFDYAYPEPEEGKTFSITARIADCPWNEDTLLLGVGIGTKKPEPGNAVKKNLVFLVDTSGSMFSDDKLPLAQDTLVGFLDSMNEDDRISIVTYAGDSRVAIDSAACDEWGKIDIMFALRLLEAVGSTWGEGGIEKAYDLAEKNYDEDANNRVILLTDGDFNVGNVDESTLVDMVKEKADGRIFLSVMGFGDGNYNDVMGETLADKGNGNYSYIDSEDEARRVMGKDLAGILETVAKDAKIQVDFNPAYIKGYRLIGYEDRALEDVDFADDAKDGGEVGAGQQVTALYELVPAGSGMDVPSAQSRYTVDETEAEAGTEGGELLTVSVRYKDPLGKESRLEEMPVTNEQYAASMDDDLSWAAGVAQIGMLVRNSEFAGDSGYRDVMDRLSAVTDGDPSREEFVSMIPEIEIQKDLWTD